MSMQGLQRERCVRVGPIDFTVAMPVELANRVRVHPVYRGVLKPTVHSLRRLGRLRSTNIPLGANLSQNLEPHDPLPPVPLTAPSPDDLDQEARAIIERIVGQEWYHSIDLGHDVVTPGFVDHREQLPYYGLPSSMAGKRVLDVATFDGFWAFEFDRRGAEVVAADIPRWTDVDVPAVLLPHADIIGLDRPTGSGFRLADEIIGSSVERVECSVYELSPEKVGMFDLVFISDLLVHLRDPQLALDRARSVCRGEVVVADVFTPRLEGFGDRALAWYTAPNETWWLPNVAGLRSMMQAAGFEAIAEVSRFTLQARTEDMIHKVVLRGEVPSSSCTSTEKSNGALVTNRTNRSNGSNGSNGGTYGGDAKTEDSLLRKHWAIHGGSVELKVSLPIGMAERMESSAAFKRLVKTMPNSHDHSTAAAKHRAAPPEPISVEGRALWTKVSGTDWLQTIELGHGVITPGRSDDREQVPFYDLPHSLVGRRVLDFAAWDGFWSFEFESRGAEVVALDLVDDDVEESMRALRGPAAWRSRTPTGLALAKESLNSKVSIARESAYAVDPERLGTFDLVFMNDVMRHLRCPQRAFERAVSVCDGDILVTDVVAPALEGMGDVAVAEYRAFGATWWLPNVKNLCNMMIVAGCEPVEEVARFDVDAGCDNPPLQKVVLRGRVNRNPMWLHEWCRTAALSPPKWRSAAERQR